MAFKPKGIGYDMAITVFSPDGSLYQVNYANEAVRRGATSVGVKSKEGVVLVADKKPPSSLVEPDSYEKISQIDDGIGAATSGMIADTRILVDRARLEAQIHKLTYDEEITVKALCKKVCDLIQIHTQYGGLRPFGASLIIAGENSSSELFVTDPSGGYIGMKAAAIGAGKASAQELFEKEYRDDIPLDDAIVLALRALKTSVEELNPKHVELVLLKDKQFIQLSEKEVEAYIKKVT